MDRACSAAGVSSAGGMPSPPLFIGHTITSAPPIPAVEAKYPLTAEE